MCGAPGWKAGRARVFVPRLEKRVIRADSRTGQDRTGQATTRIHGKSTPPSLLPAWCDNGSDGHQLESSCPGTPFVCCACRESSDGRVALALNSPGRVTRLDGTVEPASHPHGCEVPCKRLSFWQPCTASPRNWLVHTTTSSNFPMIWRAWTQSDRLVVLPCEILDARLGVCWGPPLWLSEDAFFSGMGGWISAAPA
jgi:hypothetical protein